MTFSDWNDLHCLEGLDAVKLQLDVSETPKMALYTLGHGEGEYFFTSTSNQQIVCVNSFSEKDFINLMPLEYWEAVFPGRTENSRVDWLRAKSELAATARAKGMFQARNVRGAGVWTDAGRIVVNMGDHLIVDGERVPLGSLKSRYFYTLGSHLEDLRTNPLTTEECSTLVKATSLFRWTTPDAGILLAGVLVCSRICGALPIRPHTWITGSAETGKTYLMDKLVKVVLGDSKLYVQGNTTEAGVRQGLKANAIPVLFDEFETNGNDSDSRIAAMIELMRSSWSDSDAVILKGSSTGNATAYQARFSGIVSSIRTRLENDADRGRFAILELAPHGSNQEHWLELSGLVAQIDREYAERLFARTVGMVPTIIENSKRIKAALATRSNSRFGDQYGMILAGYAALIYDGVLTEEEASWMVDQVDFTDARSETSSKDHEDALEHLKCFKVSYEGPSSRREGLLGQMIVQALKGSTAEREALLMFGIRADSKGVSIAATNHPQLEGQVFRGTRWSKSWGKSLARIPGAEKNKSVWISGSNKKCVILPEDLFQQKDQ